MPKLYAQLSEQFLKLEQEIIKLKKAKEESWNMQNKAMDRIDEQYKPKIQAIREKIDHNIKLLEQQWPAIKKELDHCVTIASSTKPEDKAQCQICAELINIMFKNENKQLLDELRNYVKPLYSYLVEDKSKELQEEMPYTKEIADRSAKRSIDRQLK
jgi:hypothetical protein